MTSDYLPETWFDPRLTIGASLIHGKGLFATQAIQEGETVMIQGGTLYTRLDLEDIRSGKIKVDEFSYSFIDDDLLIAAPDDGLDYFVNHLCDPNIWIQDNVTVVARRDIAVNEELCGDYCVWESDPTHLIENCLCASPMCRRQVTGNDWTRTELQSLYQGHFLPYISRKIARVDSV